MDNKNVLAIVVLSTVGLSIAFGVPQVAEWYGVERQVQQRTEAREIVSGAKKCFAAQFNTQAKLDILTEELEGLVKARELELFVKTQRPDGLFLPTVETPLKNSHVHKSIEKCITPDQEAFIVESGQSDYLNSFPVSQLSGDNEYIELKEKLSPNLKKRLKQAEYKLFLLEQGSIK